VLENAKVEHGRILAELKSIKIATIAKCTSREVLGARLTLEWGLKTKLAYIDWLDEG